MLFQPTLETRWIPDVPFENFMIDERIHMWLFSRKVSKGTVLFCHGNYGNITYRSYIIGLFLKAHLNVAIFDYSGFGFSKGHPSCEQICADGLSAYDYLSKKKGINSPIVCGESLGGSIAAYVASKRSCSQLILLSTFASLPEILEDKTQGNPYFQFLLSLYMMGAKDVHLLDTSKWISKLKTPILIIHSKEDDMIPFDHAKRNYDAALASGKKRLIEISGGHSSPIFSDQTLSDLFEFCIGGRLADASVYQNILEKGLRVYHANANVNEDKIEMNIRDYLTHHSL